jgi:hypothetical protein
MVTSSTRSYAHEHQKNETNGNKDAMTLEKEKSTPQGQTLTQPNPIETGTTEPQTGEQDQGALHALVPDSMTSTPKSKPRVYLTGTEGLVWDIQGTFGATQYELYMATYPHLY